jgi:hypothetical protein
LERNKTISNTVFQEEQGRLRVGSRPTQAASLQFKALATNEKTGINKITWDC